MHVLVLARFVQPKPPLVFFDIDPKLLGLSHLGQTLVEADLVSCLSLVKVNLSRLCKARESLNIGVPLVWLLNVFHINFMVILLYFSKDLRVQILHVLFCGVRELFALAKDSSLLLEGMLINSNWWADLLLVSMVDFLSLSFALEH